MISCKWRSPLHFLKVRDFGTRKWTINQLVNKLVHTLKRNYVHPANASIHQQSGQAISDLLSTSQSIGQSTHCSVTDQQINSVNQSDLEGQSVSRSVHYSVTLSSSSITYSVTSSVSSELVSQSFQSVNQLFSVSGSHLVSWSTSYFDRESFKRALCLSIVLCTFINLVKISQSAIAIQSLGWMPLGADIQSVSWSVNKPDRQVSYVNAFTYHSYVRLFFALIVVQIKICTCQVSSLISTSG